MSNETKTPRNNKFLTKFMADNDIKPAVVPLSEALPARFTLVVDLSHATFHSLLGVKGVLANELNDEQRRERLLKEIRTLEQELDCHIILVVDGQRPSLKRAGAATGWQKAWKRDDRVANYLHSNGVTVRKAAMEADSLVAHLLHTHQAHAAYGMNDSDLLSCYGCPLVIKFIDRANKTAVVWKLSDVLDQVSRKLQVSRLTAEELLAISAALPNDYNADALFSSIPQNVLGAIRRVSIDQHTGNPFITNSYKWYVCNKHCEEFAAIKAVVKHMEEDFSANSDLAKYAQHRHAIIQRYLLAVWICKYSQVEVTAGVAGGAMAGRRRLNPLPHPSSLPEEFHQYLLEDGSYSKTVMDQITPSTDLNSRLVEDAAALDQRQGVRINFDRERELARRVAEQRALDAEREVKAQKAELRCEEAEIKLEKAKLQRTLVLREQILKQRDQSVKDVKAQKEQATNKVEGTKARGLLTVEEAKARLLAKRQGGAVIGRRDALENRKP